MQVRRATRDDWERSRDIRLRALAEAPGAFCSTLERELAFDDERWMSRLDDAETFFAVEGDDVVGTATGIPDPHEGGGREIVAMWVDPAHRRSGAATALIEAQVQRARAAEEPALALWVAEDNDRAQRLYEKCGFSATGQREAMRPGIDQIRMRLELE